MEDMDLYNLSQEIPTVFPDAEGLELYHDYDEEGNWINEERLYIVEVHFLQAVKKCLDDISLFTDEEFLTYMQNFPVVGLVRSLKERIYGYCSWFDWIPNSFKGKICYIDKEACKCIFDTDKVCLRLHFKLAKWYNIIIESKYFKRVSTTGSTEDETQTDSEPNNATASTARKGRPVEPFEAILYGDDEQKLRTRKRLHEVMKGKSGKKAMVFIVAAVELGLIANPTYTQLKNEFGEGIGSQPNCDNFKNSPRQLRRDEIEGAKKLLER
jgi:hypothetical protein